MPGRWLLGPPVAAAGDTAGGTAPDSLRAVLLGLNRREGKAPDGADPGQGPDALDELENLAQTDGIAVVDRLVQTRAHPDAATYLGAGKVDELAELVQDKDAGLVIADGELSPAQMRNLEDRVGARVVDRTMLILDIFAEHAQSSEGKAQVELAQLAYQLPRLRGRGAAMSRIGGGRVAGGAGIGVRGRGEMQLEVERRHIRRRMARLRERTHRTARGRESTRGRRTRNRVPGVSVTGYTNAGKSALLNRMAGADARVEDKLFATLDPIVRRVTAPDGFTYTMTDTVGFVRHLPHQLVDAFRSTLEEVARADLVLHVVDAASPEAVARIRTVREVLKEIGADSVPELLVLNKVDAAPPERVEALARAHPGAVRVSALTGEGTDGLRQAVRARLQGTGGE